MWRDDSSALLISTRPGTTRWILKNFHAASHDAPIFPILLATEAPKRGCRMGRPPSRMACADPIAVASATCAPRSTTDSRKAADLDRRGSMGRCPVSTDADDRRSRSHALCKALSRSHLPSRRRRAQPRRDLGRGGGNHRARTRGTREGDSVCHRRTWRWEDARRLEHRTRGDSFWAKPRGVPLRKRSTGRGSPGSAYPRRTCSRSATLNAKGHPAACQAFHSERPPLPRRRRPHVERTKRSCRHLR